MTDSEQFDKNSTPRTDALLLKLWQTGSVPTNLAEHARQLERELNAALSAGREQEPVAWLWRADKGSGWGACFGPDKPDNGAPWFPVYAAPSATRFAYLVRCGGECPQDWLCEGIPEVQKAMCEALYGDPSNACPAAIGWYVEAIQKMSPEELKREWRFEDGWLEVIKLRRADRGSEHGS